MNTGRKIKIYISGAITGVKDYLEHFQKAEERLIEKGYSVINPAAVNALLPGDTSRIEYMKMSKTMLSMCEAIYMLEGWEDSLGANWENGYAQGRGYQVILEELEKGE